MTNPKDETKVSDLTEEELRVLKVRYVLAGLAIGCSLTVLLLILFIPF